MSNTEVLQWAAEADDSLTRNKILTDDEIDRTVTAEDDDDVTPVNSIKIFHSEAGAHSTLHYSGLKSKILKHTDIMLLRQGGHLVLLLEETTHVTDELSISLSERIHIYSTPLRTPFPSCYLEDSVQARSKDVDNVIVLDSPYEKLRKIIPELSGNVCPSIDHTCPICRNMDDKELEELYCSSEEVLLVSRSKKQKENPRKFSKIGKATFTQHKVASNYTLEMSIDKYESPCGLPVAVGNCSESLDRFYFDAEEEACDDFTYTGCGGNANNFVSQVQCEERCFAEDFCEYGILDIKKIVKNSDNANYLDNKFPYALPEHCNCSQILKDGRKINSKVGLAFAVSQDHIETEVHQFRIRDECSVFQAELLCIAQAVNWIRTNENLSSNFLICSDSLSSLYALNCITSPNRLIVKTQTNLNVLQGRGVQVFFSFVQGHIGIYGNERADWLAKEATKLIDFIPMTVPKSFYKSVFKKHVISQWNNLYQISRNAKSTKDFFPSIHGRLQVIHFVPNFRITQFLTGHGNFKAYLKRFNLSRTDLCSCSSGEIQDVKHLILSRSKFTPARCLLSSSLKKNNLVWLPSFSTLVQNKTCFASFCEFIDSIFPHII
ncbi:hypothetical protein AVEN_226016-1 [Araneus ventricosus]|uniref:BPTI/Kunitz inhibitor domain-containing protein n=1 Tax=Araneus ventricosus TaxID=182803 RepID=A0A4Y2HQF0_ARAVE|nr:hypothetical protein AVEN_226016-1 [Araneus ventricosus]